MPAGQHDCFHRGISESFGNFPKVSEIFRNSISQHLDCGDTTPSNRILLLMGNCTCETALPKESVITMALVIKTFRKQVSETFRKLTFRNFRKLSDTISEMGQLRGLVPGGQCMTGQTFAVSGFWSHGRHAHQARSTLAHDIEK